MYVVLALGFEGRYRVLNNGKAQLESVRERLSQMLRGGSRVDGDKTLSPRWEGVPAQVARLRDGLPMWVVASLAGLVLLGVVSRPDLVAEQRLRQRLHDAAGPRRQGPGGHARRRRRRRPPPRPGSRPS